MCPISLLLRGWLNYLQRKIIRIEKRREIKEIYKL